MNLKLRVKSNHLVSKKFSRYKVKIKEEDFIRLNEKYIFNVKKENGFIYFNCKYQTLSSLRKLDIEYQVEDKVKNYFMLNKIKIFITLIFMMMILIIFILNQIFIRNIKFKNNYYNDEIFTFVYDHLEKVGPFYILNESINEVSNDMRKKFYQYAYVGLSKRGSDLIIDVVEQVIPEISKPSTPLIGEFYASEDATILEVKLSSGQPLVAYNDVVKKGDLLATSNLQYKENLYSKDKMVPLIGIILGKTITYEEIEILKEEEIEIFTNQYTKYYILQIGENSYFEKKNPFSNFYIDVDNVLNISKLSIKKKIIYEKEKCFIKRNYDEAVALSLILLNQRFEFKRTFESEKIVSLKMINYSDMEDRFIFKYLVCAHKNIVEYRKFIEVNN